MQPSYGLSDEQVENMILESFDYAEKDLLDRQLIEARNEAETIVAALKKGKQSPAFQQLDPPEREQIWRCERDLKAARMQDDPRKLRAAIDALNQATLRFAELMMDTAVSTALKGKSMESADLGEGPAAPHPIGKAEFE